MPELAAQFDDAIAAQIKKASNRSILITSGGYSSIAPGDSINVVYAIVAAKKYGFDDPSLDTELQKSNLYSNAGWAIRAYNGEDRNGDSNNNGFTNLEDYINSLVSM